MATNIDINDVTNATTVENGTGIFDRLIGAAFLHIEKQVDEQRLTQSSAGEVYSAAIQSAMAQAIQFVLQEKQTEAQVDMILTQTSELLLNGAKDRELTDSQIIGSGYDNQVKEQQVLESTYKVEELLPVELLQLQKQVDVAERGMAEQELTGAKQREVLVVDKDIKSYQLSDILPKEAIMLTEQKETADAQQLALAKDLEIKDIQKQVTYVERVIKDKEAAILGMDNAIKIAQTSKATNGTYVYTPQYEEL